MEKSTIQLAYSLSKLINKHGGIFLLLHEKLQAGWKENLKNLSEHALPLGTSEKPIQTKAIEVYRLDGRKDSFFWDKGLCKGHKKRCKGHLQGPPIWQIELGARAPEK